MAKKKTDKQYIVVNGFENDTKRYEIDDTPTDTELKKDGFVITQLLDIGVIRPLEVVENGDGKD